MVEPLGNPQIPPTWPGQVFGAADLTYAEAMQQYVQATQDRHIHAHTPREPQREGPTRWRQEWEGRAERHQVLQQRKQEDAQWKVAQERFRRAKWVYHQFPKAQRKQQREAWQAEQAAWKPLREQQRARKQARKQENEAWHQRNQRLKAGVADLDRDLGSDR